jgi:hypothetical protein
MYGTTTRAGTSPLLHVQHAFAPAIVYVMLSRATKRSNVVILDGLKPEDFTPVNNAAFDIWEAQQRPARRVRARNGNTTAAAAAN